MKGMAANEVIRRAVDSISISRGGYGNVLYGMLTEMVGHHITGARRDKVWEGIGCMNVGADGEAALRQGRGCQ